MASTFFTDFFDDIDTLLETGIAQSVSGVASFLEPTFHTLLILYFAFQGYELLFSNDKFNVKELAYNNLKIFVIYTLAFEIAIFQDVIQSFFIGEHAFSEQLANVMFGGSSTDNKSLLDSMFSAGAKYGDEIAKSAGFFEALAFFFLGIIIGLITVILSGYAAFLIVFSKVATAILIGLAPLFILTLLFSKTSKLFEAWLGQLLNFSVMYLLIAIILKMLSSGFEFYFIETMKAKEFSLTAVASLSLYGFIFFLIIQQIPSIASAVTSGVALNASSGVKDFMRRRKSNSLVKNRNKK